MTKINLFIYRLYSALIIIMILIAMHSFVTQWINFENSFTLITREVARVSLCYAAISYCGVTFSPVILRALNFNLFCLLIKHTICEPKIWYCRIAQCHSGHLPGDLSEGIFKIHSLGHKRINKQFLKSSRRAYWTRSITNWTQSWLLYDQTTLYQTNRQIVPEVLKSILGVCYATN